MGYTIPLPEPSFQQTYWAKELQIYLKSDSFIRASLIIFWNFWDQVFMKHLWTIPGILEK